MKKIVTVSTASIAMLMLPCAANAQGFLDKIDSVMNKVDRTVDSFDRTTNRINNTSDRIGQHIPDGDNNNQQQAAPAPQQPQITQEERDILRRAEAIKQRQVAPQDYQPAAGGDRLNRRIRGTNDSYR